MTTRSWHRRWLVVAALALAGCAMSPAQDSASPGPPVVVAPSPVASPETVSLPASESGQTPVAVVDEPATGARAVPAPTGHKAPVSLHVEPAETLNLGWVADTVTIQLLADGGDIAWTARVHDADWLGVERTSGLARAGMIEAVPVRVDRDRLRQSSAPHLSAGRTASFAGTVTIQTPGREVSITVTGREPAQPVRRCLAAGRLAVAPAATGAALALSTGPEHCVDWYLVAAPRWLSLEVDQADVTGRGLVSRAVIVDPERRQRPYTTTAATVSHVVLEVDWRRVLAPVGGVVTFVNAVNGTPSSVMVWVDPAARSVSVVPASQDAETS